MKELWTIFGSFFLIGGMTFGGGYAMLPMLTREIVEKHGWATEEELLDYFAIGQCTPGVIAVNTATFVGYRRKGVLGSLFATLGVICPSVLIILAIAILLSNFMDIEWIGHAFSGIRIAVCALIAASVIKLCKTNLRGVIKVLVAVLAFATVAVLGWSPIYITVAAGVFGAFFYGRRRSA